MSPAEFGIDQGNKIRPIDDVSGYFPNSCVTTHDKINVDGVDAIANFAKLWAEHLHMGRNTPPSGLSMSRFKMVQR